MTKTDRPVHEDPELFRRVVNFTAAERGFAPRLIEKDYFCSLLLEYLSDAGETLVFKGGACLAKVHADFYRMSEDLDFAIATPTDAPRKERSARASPLKKTVADLPRHIPCFRLAQPLTGANNSMQYVAIAEYGSLLGQQVESVKIEVGLREPLLTPVVDGPAQTLLLDPVSGQALLRPVVTRTISKKEAFAEKFRVALSRRDVAIRDFYDIDYATRHLDIHPTEAAFVDLVRQKLAVPGNDPVDISDGRKSDLRLQLQSQLKPVLRTADLASFDLDRAFQTVAEVAVRL